MNNDQQMIWKVYEDKINLIKESDNQHTQYSNDTHKKYRLTNDGVNEEFKKLKDISDMWEKLSMEPSVKNLAGLAIETYYPMVFANPELWYDTQEMAKKALKLVKTKTALEINNFEKDPQTPEELFITYISPDYRSFKTGGKTELIRILNKIISEDRWEMLAQNRENWLEDILKKR